ncbi:MAG: iron chelate uptake ABC transporter family permease subunit [Hyphomicrobium sp.]|nr:iron chelate uptake ABC transporter family permease subunit [Hyphomicrobium sp.]
MTSTTGIDANWPSAAEILNILLLGGGYNTVVVMIGVSLLGLAAGVVGTFGILRKRAMMSDTLSHATLPGIALAFLAAEAMGMEGRSLPILLAGAIATGLAGVLAVHAIVRSGRLAEDTAMGAVLSVFFAVGLVLLSYIQTLDTGSEGGLAKFIYGQTAAMSAEEAWAIAVVAALALTVTIALLKEFRVVAFDENFAAVQGWPVARIDLLMMALIVAVTVIGLKAVGLILIVALIVIPAAAARFWTERLGSMVAIAGFFGWASGYMGSALSALVPGLPAGGIIVLVAGAFFLSSLLFAPRRGILASLVRNVRQALEVERQHLLRRIYEHAEETGRRPGARITLRILPATRNWSMFRRLAVLGSLSFDRLLRHDGGTVTLTDAGVREAVRVTRNHRLWERYLVSAAGLEPSHVDRSADLVEHVLDGDIIRRLEEELRAAGRLPRSPGVPDSVHPLAEATDPHLPGEGLHHAR